MNIDDTMLGSDGFIVWLLSVSKQAQCTQTDGWKRDRDPDSPLFLQGDQTSAAVNISAGSDRLGNVFL